MTDDKKTYQEKVGHLVKAEHYLTISFANLKEGMDGENLKSCEQLLDMIDDTISFHIGKLARSEGNERSLMTLVENIKKDIDTYIVDYS